MGAASSGSAAVEVLIWRDGVSADSDPGLLTLAGRSTLGWQLAAVGELGLGGRVVTVPRLPAGDGSAAHDSVPATSDLRSLRLAEEVLLLRGDAPLLSAVTLAGLCEAAVGTALVGVGERSSTVIAARVSGGRLGEALGGRAEDFDRLVTPLLEGERRIAVPAEESLVLGATRDRVTAHRCLVTRIVDHWLERGVVLLDPGTVQIDVTVELAAGVEVHSGVALLGCTSVAEGCVLHQGSWLRDTRLGREVEVHPYTVLDGAQLAERCSVGPFARLRPGTVLRRTARVGNFVEIKKSTLGEGAKANHLAYVGDAEVGDRSNIGAGVVTCNYDGVAKHRTRIGSDAFVGTDTILVAPVEIGDGAFTAAGSVIVQDVPADALGIGRARQRNVEGWARRHGPAARRQRSE